MAGFVLSRVSTLTVLIVIICNIVAPFRPPWYRRYPEIGSDEHTPVKSRSSPLNYDDDAESDGRSGDWVDGKGWKGMDPLLTPRIIGGRRAKFGEVPFQVRVEIYHNIICGGSLLDHCGLKFVLTAGHCVYKGNPNASTTHPVSAFTVYGADLDQYSYQPREQVFTVKRVLLHPYYDPRYILNDIAILFLDRHVFESVGLEHVELPEPGWSDPEYCRISGWGSEVLQASTSRYLQVAEVPVMPWEICRHLKTEGWIGFLGPKEFCLGNKDSNQRIGACSGDSGGPAVGYNFTTQTWHLYGIASYVITRVCGGRYAAGAFTRVINYVDWIKGAAQGYLDAHGTGNPYTNGKPTC